MMSSLFYLNNFAPRNGGQKGDKVEKIKIKLLFEKKIRYNVHTEKCVHSQHKRSLLTNPMP